MAEEKKNPLIGAFRSPPPERGRESTARCKGSRISETIHC